MKKAFFTILFIFLAIAIKAQDIHIIDSLQKQIISSDGINKAIAYNKAAKYYVLNNPDTSILFAKEALFISFLYEDLSLQAEALGTIGESYFYKSEYDSSIVFYLNAIRISEKLNDRKKLVTYYNGIGTVFYQLGDFKKALIYMKQASEIKLEDGELVSYAVIIGNIGAIMQRLGKNKEAMSLLRDAEKILTNSNYPGILANLYNTIGSVFQVGFNDLDSAEFYYKKNISLIKQPGLEAFRLAAYINVGEIYVLKGKLNEAELNFKKGLELSILLQRRVEKISIYGSLSDLYEKKKEFVNAYYYKKQQMLLKDSVFTEDKEKIILQLEAQYQTEKKDLQIKEQQLTIQKKKNRENSVIFISVVVALLLLVTSFYFWIKKRSKDELEKAKSRIFQNIVHEIRTPLTLIHGPLHLLRKEYQTDQNKEHFELIEKNSERLIALVDELLITAKLEKNEYKLSYQVGDIVVFTQKLVDAFQQQAIQNDVDLSFKSNVAQQQVRFPASAFEKILNNLVSNSIKYNRPNGYVKVSLSITEKEIELLVEDNGVGISKKNKDKLFERFYRVDAQNHKQGFGIGLSVVAELVHLSGGSIDIESKEGEGTQAKILIPLENTGMGKNEDHDINNTENELILVVEDNDDMYDFIYDILVKRDCKLLRARNGAEGFNMALELIPDIIISDVMMPVEDGLSMTKKLKINELSKHIPIVILSAKASVESRLEGMGVGADTYLAKPFNPEELVFLVNNTLQTLKNNRIRYSKSVKEENKPYHERVAGNDLYLKKIVELVDHHILETGFSVNELADAMHISRSQLHRKITSLTGLSTTHFIRTIRLEKAKDLLLANAGNVTEIAYQCGFNSQSYFTKTFTEHFGMAPSDLLK